MYQKQFKPDGFQWIEYNDQENTVISFIRKGNDPKDDLIVVCNFTPMPRENYRLGVPKNSTLKLLFNSDDKKYSGSGVGKKTVKPSKTSWNGHEQSVLLNLPPLGVVVYK